MFTSFRPNGLPVPRSWLPGTLVRIVEPLPPVTPEETGNVTVPEESGPSPVICPICEKTVTDASESDAGDDAIFWQQQQKHVC